MDAKVKTIITKIKEEANNFRNNAYKPSISAWTTVAFNVKLLHEKITEKQRSKRGRLGQARLALKEIYYNESPELFILCGLAIPTLLLGCTSRKKLLQELKVISSIISECLAKLGGISLFLSQSVCVEASSLAQMWQQQSNSHLASLDLRHVYQFAETPVELIPLLTNGIILAMEASGQYQRERRSSNMDRTDCIKILTPEDPLEDGELRIKVSQDEALKLSYTLSQRLISSPLSFGTQSPQ